MDIRKEILKHAILLDHNLRFARVDPSFQGGSPTAEFLRVVDISPRNYYAGRSALEATLQDPTSGRTSTAPVKILQVSSGVYQLKKPLYGLKKDQLILEVAVRDRMYTYLYFSQGGTLLLEYDFSPTMFGRKAKVVRHYRSNRNLFKFFTNRKG